MVLTLPRPRPRREAGPRGTVWPPPCSLAQVILSALATLGGSGRGLWGSVAQARGSSRGDSEATTKVVSSFSHAGPGQLCGAAEERVCWGLPLSGPVLFLTRRGGGGLSRGHPAPAVTHLGENGKIRESRGQACVPSCGTALRESHGSLVSPHGGPAFWEPWLWRSREDAASDSNSYSDLLQCVTLNKL